MEQLKDNIESTIQEAKNTAVLFYQQKTQEGYAHLDITLNCLMLTANQILAYQRDKADKIMDEEQMNAALAAAMNAIEQRDIILLADVLFYEVNGLLEESLNRI